MPAVLRLVLPFKRGDEAVSAVQQAWKAYQRLRAEHG
jgi:hypothetical protein